MKDTKSDHSDNPTPEGPTNQLLAAPKSRSVPRPSVNLIPTPDTSVFSSIQSWVSSAIRRLKEFFKRRSAEKKFHLHLGVHKTATTYTQIALSDNNDLLRQNGILYWDLNFTRKNITPFMRGLSRKKNHPDEAEECEVRLLSLLRHPEVENSRRVLISDENLLGFISGVFDNGGYKGISKRFKPVRDILNKDVKVFITIRNYADFFSSVYCELITTKSYVPFERAKENPALMEFSWLSVYEELVRVFGRKNVVVFEFQSVATNLKEVVAEILGSGIELKMPENQIRVSPSGNAVDFIRLETERKTGKTLNQIVKNATDRFPKNATNPPYDPWTKEERALLDARYRNDLQKIDCWRPPG